MRRLPTAATGTGGRSLIPTIAPMELDALIRALAPGDVVGRRAVEIRDLAYDTRDVHEGALFFCVPGATRDGHDLAPEAVADGAVASCAPRE